MITALLALLFIVKPSGHLTQCLLYKTYNLQQKNKLVLNLIYFLENSFFYEIQHYTNQGLFSYANLGFYQVDITPFVCFMYQF